MIRTKNRSMQLYSCLRVVYLLFPHSVIIAVQLRFLKRRFSHYSWIMIPSGTENPCTPCETSSPAETNFFIL